MTKELAKTLTTALVQWIDRERPEGTMCCSNAECESIEQMFEGGCYDIVESLIKKKLTGLTEFEKCMLDFAKARDEYEFDSTKVVELNNKVIELTKSYSKKLLALAKKELFKLWNENMKDEYARGKRDGVTIGYNKAMKEYNESVAYHYDNDLGKKHLEGYILGREDTMREMKDFIDSHFNTNKAKEGEDLTDLYRKEYERNPESVPIGVAYKSPQCYTDILITPNINSGTSTLKAEE